MKFNLTSFLALAFISNVSIITAQNSSVSLSQDSNNNAFNSAPDEVLNALQIDSFVKHTFIIDSIDWTTTSGDTNDRLMSQFARANYFTNRGEKKKGIALLNHILSSDLITKSMAFDARLLLRNTYFSINAYDKAMFEHKNLNWSDTKPFFESYAPSYFIAFVYLEIGNYRRASELLKTSIMQMRKHGYNYYEMSLTNSLGVCFEKMGALDSAMIYYSKATDLLKANFRPGEELSEERFNAIYGLFEGNKGQILAAKGRHLEAIPLLKVDVYASFKDSTNISQRENGIISLLKLAQSYTATNQTVIAQSTIKEAAHIMRKVENPELWELLYQTKILYFEQQKATDSAYLVLKSLIKHRDSMNISARKTRSQNLIMAYESLIEDEEKLKNIEEIEVLKMKAESQKNRIILFLIVLILSLAIAAYTSYRIIKRSKEHREIQEKNKEILAQKVVIEKALKEKETLLREVNHRVKNNLQIIASLLYFQSKKIDDEQSREALRVSQQRVQTMSLIHQKLYQADNFEHIEFQVHIEDLVRQIISSYKTDDIQIKLSINTHQVSISVGQAVPLSLIVHELVTNSIKHAFVGKSEGTITLALSKQGINGILEYSDNGGRFLPADAQNGNGQIGLNVIRLLVNQLKGEIEIVENESFNARIIFKLE